MNKKSFLNNFVLILTILQTLFIIGGLGCFVNNTFPILNIAIVISLINSVILYIKMIKKNLSLNEKIETTDYFRDLNFKMIEPIAAGIVTKKEKIGFNSILIIIYELIDKGIIIRRYHHNDVYLKLKPGITLEEIKQLKKEEQSIIKIIFTSIDDSNEYEIKQMITNIKGNINKNNYLNIILKEMQQNIKKKYMCNYMDMLFADRQVLMSYMIIIPIIPILLILLGLLFDMNQSFDFSFIYILYIINIIFYTYFCYKESPTEGYFDEVKKLNGLYNFLNDFSNIKNSEIKYIEIYDKYYLYALGLGLTSKIEKQYNFDAIDTNLKSNFKYLFYIGKGDKENE